jgi:outer membrane protein OmpA-like peptidoglycan-associated protein
MADQHLDTAYSILDPSPTISPASERTSGLDQARLARGSGLLEALQLSGVVARVYFPIDSEALDARAAETIARVAGWIAADPGIARLRIIGHADEGGGDDHDRTISFLRANATKVELVRLGADPARLEMVRRGNSCPVVTSWNGRVNRRVELEIVRA